MMDSFVSRPLTVLLLLVLAGCDAPAAAPHSARNTTQNTPHPMPERFGFGREVSEDEIAAWDIDIMPDGTGLPTGEGSVAAGQVIYEQKCIACHGASGTGGPNDRLVGRLPEDAFAMDTDLAQRRFKAVGSYWPYSTTLFDYIRRAMPQPMPGSLDDDEVYALTAYIV